ncbi:hypothetical protein PR202_gb05256 [Eleusine coracana subsp. coracana]|uniref:Plant heme peroxidase family profile domain-containing protein n=1 Tax=Eleusine coracana subsp. coracana TaxID=191504 RepID=A0AAV5E4W9_ELECO|nr:hypothetical protein PR202_gb05256 [Eleusine coracana subsp. coracana]
MMAPKAPNVGNVVGVEIGYAPPPPAALTPTKCVPLTVALVVAVVAPPAASGLCVRLQFTGGRFRWDPANPGTTPPHPHAPLPGFPLFVRTPTIQTRPSFPSLVSLSGLACHLRRYRLPDKPPKLSLGVLHSTPFPSPSIAMDSSSTRRVTTTRFLVPRRVLFLQLLLLVACAVGTSRAREAPQPLLPQAAAKPGGGTRRAPERHGLSLDFYAKSCPAVDQIVANVTAARFRDFPASGPGVLRLLHHDCFVEGCDASILIAPTAAGVGGPPKVERDMEENRYLPQDAFDTVEMAKAAVETKCPGIVSCADVLALAARDYVQLASAAPLNGMWTFVRLQPFRAPGCARQTCARPANASVDELLRVFASKGLDSGDLVALSGAHTVGFAHCVHVLGRIYDFRGTRRPDPLMDARLVKALRMSCPSSGGSARVVVPFDVSTPFQFDHAYYANLQARLGLLASDQALFLDARTRPLVEDLAADKARFFQAFVASMDRMGSIRIKKGKKGEVRKVCSQHLP